MQLEAFSAHVVVDGKALDEYDTVYEGPTKATCWIASEEGKSFGTKWKCHDASRIAANQGCVHVDGICCGKATMSPGILGDVNDTNLLSYFVHGTTRRELLFSRVELSDDDSLLNKQIPKNLGEITLTIQRGALVWHERRHRTNKNGFPVVGDNKFHERSKKATVHCIGFGPEQARKRRSHYWRLIPNNDPVLTFVFKYCPFNMLQANGIVPRAPSSAASASCGTGSRNLNDRILNLENELQYLRDLQARSSEDWKPKRIKMEERRQPFFTLGEIIDLT